MEGQTEEESGLNDEEQNEHHDQYDYKNSDSTPLSPTCNTKHMNKVKISHQSHAHFLSIVKLSKIIQDMKLSKTMNENLFGWV